MLVKTTNFGRTVGQRHRDHAFGCGFVLLVAEICNDIIVDEVPVSLAVEAAVFGDFGVVQFVRNGDRVGNLMLA